MCPKKPHIFRGEDGFELECIDILLDYGENSVSTYIRLFIPYKLDQGRKDIGLDDLRRNAVGIPFSEGVLGEIFRVVGVHLQRRVAIEERTVAEKIEKVLRLSGRVPAHLEEIFHRPGVPEGNLPSPGENFLYFPGIGTADKLPGLRKRIGKIKDHFEGCFSPGECTGVRVWGEPDGVQYCSIGHIVQLSTFSR